MTPTPESLDTGETMPVAFGSLFDLARLRIGGASAETCDACNTINPVHALACKCCAHKLPAFHARMRGGFGGGTLNPLLLCRNALLETERAWNAKVIDIGGFYARIAHGVAFLTVSLYTSIVNWLRRFVHSFRIYG